MSRTKSSTAPSHFILRRTLVNADCYTTQKLTTLESELKNVEALILEEEQRLFLEVRDKVKVHIQFLLAVAAEAAYTDLTASFAHLAVLRGYVRPQVDKSGAFFVESGRHPVVEQFLPVGEFVPNDAELSDGKTFALITGPNMAGKSTYLRQNALITLLAQVGSFVPAAKARIGVVDRIFCRVGASDNLAQGESTFLVEMSETALILRSATAESLVIMDEVGRGTSTEDGLAMAWAVSEHLLTDLGCKTLFATHYHELTRLVHPALRLLCLDVLEQDGNVVFLKKIRSGASANSYGIHVARLAGVPDSVIDRAREVLRSVGTGEVPQVPVEAGVARAPPPLERGLFSEEELIIDELSSLNTDRLTPLEALQMLARWKKNIEKSDGKMTKK
jgi:DNA mismatch repair protein MutS